MTRNIVIGLHIGHDRSVSALENGKLVAHIAEERLDRIKHSSSVKLPRLSFYAVLEELSAQISDISAVGVTYSFVDMNEVGGALSEEIREELGLGAIPIYPVGHHLAHAYSTYYTSPFDDALVLVADGAGDLVDGMLESESAYLAKNGELSLMWRRLQDVPSSYSTRRTFFHPPYIPLPDRQKQISFARKYEQFTYALDFGWGQSGKTMGLASYGSPLFGPPTAAMEAPDFRLDMMDMLRELEQIKEVRAQSWGVFLRNERENISATVQAAIEKCILEVCNYLHSLAGTENICLAGGLFLNCVINHKIIAMTPFERIHICPAAGDDGQSIGAAFYAYKAEGNKLEAREYTPYLGPSYTTSQTWNAIVSFGDSASSEIMTEDKIINEILERIASNQVVAIFRGRSEMGPRALGHRSILANPSSDSIRNHINRYVKHREDFRPFAPMVISESQFEYFELKTESPLMLLSAQVRSEWQNVLSSVTHVDGSARIQAIKEEVEPFLHKLLSRATEFIGVPILLNTSFNGYGEPIIETPRDALHAFHRSNIDMLVLNEFVIKKH